MILAAALALFFIIALIVTYMQFPGLFSPTDTPEAPVIPGPVNSDSISNAPTSGVGPSVPSSGGTLTPTEGTPTTGTPTTTPPPASTPPAGETADPDQPPAETVAAPSSLAWPMRGKTVAAFGIIQSVTLGDWRQHDGIDIQVAEGSSVAAAASGTVTAVERRNDTGLTVVIDHGGGLTSIYGCLLVTGRNPGDQVKAGDEIGKAGNSGLSEVGLGVHLHFGVMRGETSVDPNQILK